MTIPIFLSADNNYAPFIATTIVSICSNTKSSCDFYVLDGGIAEDNKLKIQKLGFQNYSCSFLRTDIEKYIDTKSYSNTAKHVSLSTFNRLLIPKLTNEEKVIYLDVDIVVNLDIQNLYDIPLGNYMLAAVKEPGDKINLGNLNKNIGLLDNNAYFNAGVLLINNAIWKNEYLTDKLFEIYSKQDNLKYADQDLLNIYFADNYKLLNEKFNRVCPTSSDYIIHYTGATKPWHLNPDNCSFEEVKLFWKYAKLTPFYDELYSKTLNEVEQKQKYMLYRIQRMAKSRFYGK